MLNETKSISRNGNIVVQSGEEEKVVAYVSANVEDTGNASFSVNITNKSEFVKNMAEVKKDLNAFMDGFYESMGGEK